MTTHSVRSAPPGPVRAVRHPFHNPRVAAPAATVAGVVATGLGAGIGVRFAQKTGLSFGTLAGLAVLAAGLALLGYATSVAWKGLRRWRRLALLPAAFVAIELILPIAGGAAFSVVPPTSLGKQTPATFGIDFRNVTFRTADGVSLSAWYVPTHNGAAVVMRHGAGSTRTSTLPQAAVVAHAGYGVLLVDARGHGRSGGAGNDRGWYGDRDNAAAVTFLSRQPGVHPDRIGVLGLSMGGEEAVGAAGSDRRIRTVIAEGVTARTAADKARWLPDGVSGLIERGMDLLTDGVVVAINPASRPRSLHSAVVAAPASFLLITAGQEPNEARAAADLRAAAPERVTVWSVPGAAHTRGLAADPVGWRAHVIAFLDAHLVAT